MDDGHLQNERISIKNLLFTKAIPNYIIPIPTDYRTIYTCKDCGDKYLIESSYEYHINRKALKITYFCKYCNIDKVFYNRCNLLCHIRSHFFKTATINVSDIKIEPLPLSFFKFQDKITTEIEEALEVEVPLPLLSPISREETDDQIQEQNSGVITCYECKKNIFSSGVAYRDRAKHFTQITNGMYSCPICLYTVTTQCALKAHLRLHLKEPPYFCPECGVRLSSKTLVYPYTHDCETFKMLRVTAKLTCLQKNCSFVFHPNDVLKHLKSNHLKKILKCAGCTVACYKIENIQKHLSTHKDKFTFQEFLRCELCPGRLINPSQIDRHLKAHENIVLQEVFPCWLCGLTFRFPKSLIIHQMYKHKDTGLKELYGNVFVESVPSIFQNQKASSLFKVCKTYNPPNKMSTLQYKSTEDVSKILCHLCKEVIILDWNRIKQHYAKYHKEHKCVDMKIVLKKLNLNQLKATSVKKRKTINRKAKNSTTRNKINKIVLESKNDKTLTIYDKLFCTKCNKQFENKEVFEKHIVQHKDPFMAYQCMECGESFITKPSFTTHLLLKHRIENVDEYINEKKCYCEESLRSQKPYNIESDEPVKENQCSICREQFCNSTDLEKHFRVHGMAFLMKNTTKAISPDK